ncbi:hypothetical protein MJ699_28765 [Klebsiella pneumoniae]|nr:hypothetical protein MJ699_28765 [Klebsiella pneumoniae]
MTAAVSIGLASYTGMPVSTTHVLSLLGSGDDAGGWRWSAEKDGDQHPDGLGADPAGSGLSFQASFTGSP